MSSGRGAEHGGQTCRAQASHEEVRSSIHDRVKPITYKIDTCCYLVWWSTLLGLQKNWLAQDNVSKCDIRLWWWRPDPPVGQHYKITTSEHHHRWVPILLWTYMLPGCKTLRSSKQCMDRFAVCGVPLPHSGGLSVTCHLVIFVVALLLDSLRIYQLHTNR